MADKITPKVLTSGFASIDALNTNFSDIATELNDKVLYRKTSEPNQMETTLDMNSNRLINLPSPLNNTDAARFQDILDGLVTTDTVLPSPISQAGKYLGASGGSFIFQSTAGLDWINTGSGAVSRTVDAKLKDTVNIKDYGAVMDGVTDDTPALLALVTAFPTGNVSVLIPEGTLRVITGDVDLPSNITFMGKGMGISKIELHATTNPASTRFIFKLLARSNIFFKDLTFTATARAEGIFNLGTLDGNGVYGPDQLGLLLGMRISQCTNVNFYNVEVEGFNGTGGAILFTNEDNVKIWNTEVSIINCYGHDNRMTGFSLQAVDGFHIIGGVHEKNGLQVFDSVDAAGNPTSNVRTPTNFIDGGTGYGILVGRQTSASKLRSKNGKCIGVTTRKNVRHGLDSHSGYNIEIIDCLSEDDLKSAWISFDIGPFLDTGDFGDFKISGGSVRNSVYSETRGNLFDARTAGDERDDSQPIFLVNLSGSMKNNTIDSVDVTGYSFTQINNHSATDTIMFATMTSNRVSTITNCKFVSDDPDFFPSKIVRLAADKCIFKNNTVRYGTRGTFDAEAIFLNSDVFDSEFLGNSIEEINTFSTGTTEVRRSPLNRGQGIDTPLFVGNTLVRTSQATKGSLWKVAAGANARLAFAGFLGTNSGNLLDGKEYASVVEGDRTFHITSAGAGNKDGASVTNAFSADSAANFQIILDQLPTCTGILTLSFSDSINLGSGTAITIPDHYGKTVFQGVNTETSLSSSKTAKILTTGSNLFTCPLYSDISFKFLEIKSSGIAVNRPTEIQACAIENISTASGQIGIKFERTAGLVQNTNFEKGDVAIQAIAGSSVLSIANGSGTAPSNALNANSSAIYKNGTQPAGGELAQNGGTIA